MMYLNNYKNTNIDKDFKNNNFDFNKFKIPLFVLLGIIVIIVIIFFVFKFTSNKKGTDDPVVVEEEETYTINVFSESEITLLVGSEVVIPNYTATDSKGNDVTNEVYVDNEVDTSTSGEYIISFSLGNTYQEIKVKVIESSEEKIPIIINKDSILYLNVGDTYTEYGCTAYSNGVNYCNNVDISSNVDTSKAGIYKVIYNVKSATGVTSSVVRTVIVLDSELTLIEKSNYDGVAVIKYVTNTNYFSYIILPDGTKSTSKDGEYSVKNSGTYKFTLYNTKGGSFDKEINVTVKSADKIAPKITTTCNIKDGKTYVSVSSSDTDIDYYLYNDARSSDKSYTINNEVSTIKVVAYDTSGNSSSSTCSPSYDVYNANITGSVTFKESSDTINVVIEDKGGYYITHIWMKDPYNQMRTAVTTPFDTTVQTAETIFKNTIKSEGLENKIAVAVNASGFVYGSWDPIYQQTISGWANTSVSPIVIVNNQVLRDYSYNVPKTKHVTYGLKSDGYLGYYYYQKGKNLQSNLDLTEQLKKDGVKYTFAFCPVLLLNGEIKSNGEIGDYAGSNVGKRQGLCQINKNNFVLINTKDSSTTKFKLASLAEMMKEQGCVTGFNLDGGGSVSFLYKSKNSSTPKRLVPTGSQRKIADILYFTE